MRKALSISLVLICLMIPFVWIAYKAERGWEHGEITNLADAMPRSRDWVSSWWWEGFPGVVEGAPWQRAIRTGNFGLIQDTRNLSLPHLGASIDSLESLSGADLRLSMVVNGKRYDCREGAEWSRFEGPRVIEAGRVFVRTDVTGLVFESEDGSRLNTEARLETMAWSDRLGFALEAVPGEAPIQAGEKSFGRVNGGFGLTGNNRLEIPAEECETPSEFTIELWAFVPEDFQAGKVSPWLLCKNGNEYADGNFGFLLSGESQLDGRMNLGGGPDNVHLIRSERNHAVRIDQWNHLALSYDGKKMRLYLNGKSAGEKEISLARIPRPGGMCVGGRQDHHGDGYPFRGVVDEIRLYDRALSTGELRLHFDKPEEVRPELQPIREWTFRSDVPMSRRQVSEKWKSATMQIEIKRDRSVLESHWEMPEGETWEQPRVRRHFLWIDPLNFTKEEYDGNIQVSAINQETGGELPVSYDMEEGWYRINMDDVEPVPPAHSVNPTNDAIERIRLHLNNRDGRERPVRLMFEKTQGGIHQRIGAPITGVSAILRDADGFPTGIPVQLSKNWHNHPNERGPHSGQWFHGISQVRMPLMSELELELAIVYGHWGGLPAASHSQLSLVGWGGNQLWHQAAMGAWGESICFDPEQAQRNCSITDVRPLMVSGMKTGGQWNWTHNVGGGDYFRLFDEAGERIPHSGVRSDILSHGPCLTRAKSQGRFHQVDASHESVVSLARSGDLVCTTFQLKLDVQEPIDFSRFVVFQIGADTYVTTREEKFAVGNETGLVKEWEPTWGGDAYHGAPIECVGRIPWVSLHQVEGLEGEPVKGALANRGLVIRSWNAVLGGKAASPWIAERGIDAGGDRKSSIIDLVPPPGVTRLEIGDFIEATIELLVIPQYAEYYYGPDEELRKALEAGQDSWLMVVRHAFEGERRVKEDRGLLEHLYPDVFITAREDRADFSLSGGNGQVPLTIGGLSSHAEYVLTIDGQVFDQSVHGNDFWQTDYDTDTDSWSHTYNIPAESGTTRRFRFRPLSLPTR